MRKVLIISPSFPPMNTADMQRVRLSLPYYREHGWEPVVVCVHERLQDGARDEDLLGTVPDDVRVLCVGALPRRLCRLFGVGNLGLRSFLHYLFGGWRILRRERPDVVLFSTTQFALFPLARIWTFLTSIPCVVDLHDPWVTDAYSLPGAPRPPGGWKYRFASLTARLLEGWSFRRLGGFMSVSEIYLQDLARRHTWFASIPADTIGFGASEADLIAAPEGVSASQAGTVSLVYTGAAGPSLNRILPEFLEGLALLRRKNPEAAARLRVHFVGTSYVPEGQGRPTVLPLAREAGVEDLIDEIPHRKGHLECIARQRDADVLLLLGSLDPAYSPSKLYPYLLADRPLLALAVAGGVLERLLRGLNASRLVTIDPEGRPGAASGLIADILEDIAAGRPIEDLTQRRREDFRRDFLARSLTGRQCRLLEQALKFHAGQAARSQA